MILMIIMIFTSLLAFSGLKIISLSTVFILKNSINIEKDIERAIDSIVFGVAMIILYVIIIPSSNISFNKNGILIDIMEYLFYFSISLTIFGFIYMIYLIKYDEYNRIKYNNF